MKKPKLEDIKMDGKEDRKRDNPNIRANLNGNIAKLSVWCFSLKILRYSDAVRLASISAQGS